MWAEADVRQLTEKARLFLDQAEHFYQLAQDCSDSGKAAHLTVLGNEFLNKAAQTEEEPSSRHGTRS